MSLKYFIRAAFIKACILAFAMPFTVQAEGSPVKLEADVKGGKTAENVKGVRVEDFVGKIIIDSTGTGDTIHASLEGDTQYLKKITIETKYEKGQKILFVAYEKGAPIVQDIEKVVLTLKMSPKMPLDLTLVGGKGEIGPRETNDTKINLMGYGDIHVASVQDLISSIDGSGEITINKINGNANLTIRGDGTFLVNGGTISDLKAVIHGTGIITVKGDVGNADLTSDGAGTINLTKVKHTLRQSTSGAGKINIAQISGSLKGDISGTGHFEVGSADKGKKHKAPKGG